MKKQLVVIFLTLVLCIGISGCKQNIENNTEGSQATPLPTANQESPNETPSSQVSVQPSENPAEMVDLKTDSGRYVGQADSNFIEIEISGVPNEISAKVFMLSQDIKDSFDELGLETGDNIKFNYYINENNQNVIVSIEKI